MQTIMVWAWLDGQTPTGEPILRRALADGTERPAGVPESAWLAEQDAQAWRTEILRELDALDTKSIRALREGNVERIAQIEALANDLRGILRALANA